MASPAYKFIPVPSAWFDPKLEEHAANIEIKVNALPNTEDGNERRADLWAAFDLLAAADAKLADAGYSL